MRMMTCPSHTPSGLESWVYCSCELLRGLLPCQPPCLPGEPCESPGKLRLKFFTENINVAIWEITITSHYAVYFCWLRTFLSEEYFLLSNSYSKLVRLFHFANEENETEKFSHFPKINIEWKSQEFHPVPFNPGSVL